MYVKFFPAKESNFSGLKRFCSEMSKLASKKKQTANKIRKLISGISAIFFLYPSDDQNNCWVTGILFQRKFIQVASRYAVFILHVLTDKCFQQSN